MTDTNVKESADMFDEEQTVSEFVREHKQVWDGVLKHFGGCESSAWDSIRDDHIGIYDFLAEVGEMIRFAKYSVDSIPKGVEIYIDFEQWAKDRIALDEIFIVNDDESIHAFWSHPAPIKGDPNDSTE